MKMSFIFAIQLECDRIDLDERDHGFLSVTSKFLIWKSVAKKRLVSVII